MTTESPAMLEYAVKAGAEDMTLDILGGPYGVDRKGQEFTPETDFGDLPVVPLIYFHGWGADDGERIGWAYKAARDGRGQWYKGVLDPGNATAKKVFADAKINKASASSDALSHLVRPIEALKGAAGKIKRWIIGAISVMDSTNYDRAINPRAIALPAVRAYYDQLLSGLNDDDGTGEADATKAGAVFARRNRDRILHFKALLDEMLSEFPKEESDSDSPVTKQEGTKAMESEVKTEATPAVNVEPKDTPQDVKAIVAQAVKAALGEAIPSALAEYRKAMDEEAVKANRPKFGGQAPAVIVKEQDADALARKAFELIVRKGDDGLYQELVSRAPSDLAVKAALNWTTDAQGGYLVPTKYSNEIVKPLNIGSLWRAVGAKVVPIDGTDSFKVPTLTNTTRAVVTAEATTYNEVEPTFGEVEFTPWKMTRLSKTSKELLNNSRVPVVDQIIIPDAQNAFILGENADFTTGNGSATAQGVTVGATVGVTAAGTNAITSDEIIDLFHSLAEQYRGNAVWVMKDATLKAIRKFRENGTTGAYLWQPALSQGQPSTILGRPVYTLPDMPAATTGLKPIVFGDMSYYWITDFGGAQVYFQRLNELYAATGEVGFLWDKYIDGNVMLSAAIKSLLMA